MESVIKDWCAFTLAYGKKFVLYVQERYDLIVRTASPGSVVTVLSTYTNIEVAKAMRRGHTSYLTGEVSDIPKEQILFWIKRFEVENLFPPHLLKELGFGIERAANREPVWNL